MLRVVERDAPTGVALIEVAADGETTIVVAPGANAELEAGDVDVTDADAVLCQLEIPDDVPCGQRPKAGTASSASTPLRHDRSTSSPTCSSSTGSSTRSSVTSDGLDGGHARSRRRGPARGRGEEVARAAPPPVDAVDGTAAGDAFTACLLVSLLEGRSRRARRCAAHARRARSPPRDRARSRRCRRPPRSTRSSAG